MVPTFALGSRLACTWCLASALMSAMPVASRAEPDDASPRVHFDLPSQPLEKALSAFSRITGHSVLVDSAMTRGLNTSVVRGELSARDGLRQLLAGTGLSARYSGRDAFTLVPDGAPASSQRAPSVDEPTRAAPALEGVLPPTTADFAGALQAAITTVMCKLQPDTFGRYRAAFQLWIDAEGRVRHARLLEPSGVKARDAELLLQLRRLDVGRSPPAGLAQPLTVLLSPRSGASQACGTPVAGEE